MFFSDWSFLAPFMTKSIGVAIGIGILGIIVGLLVYKEPEDFE